MLGLHSEEYYPDYGKKDITPKNTEVLSGQDENLIFLAILNGERQSIIDEFIAKKEKGTNDLGQINKENHTKNSLDENIETYRAMVGGNLMCYNRKYNYETDGFFI